MMMIVMTIEEAMAEAAAVAEAEETVEDGTEITKDILRQPSVAGKIVPAEVVVRPAAAEMMMTIAVDAEAATAEAEAAEEVVAKAVAGLEIRKDIRKLQSAVGKNVQAEAAVRAEMTMMIVADVEAAAEVVAEAAVAAAAVVTDADGMEITKDTPKLQSADGKAAAVAVLQAGEEVHVMTTMTATAEVEEAEAVAAVVADKAAGSVILKVTRKLRKEAGKTEEDKMNEADSLNKNFA